MKHRLFASIAFLNLLVSGCGDRPAASGGIPQAGEAATQVAQLKQRIAELENENAELRKTPAMLAAAVDTAGDDIAKAEAAAATLKERYPSSPEAVAAVKKIAAMAAAAERTRAEAQRLAELGLKAIKITPRFVGDEATLDVSGAALGKRWTFDAYDDQYFYKEAEKGSTYATARVKVGSTSKDPKIPGLALYRSDGANLAKVDMFMLRFARWESFATYLGNNADYRNDFAHSSTIPMTMGVEIPTAGLTKPLYFVASKAPCYRRQYERFQQPPVSYYRDDCAGLKDTLTTADFAGGGVAVVQRID